MKRKHKSPLVRAVAEVPAKQAVGAAIRVLARAEETGCYEILFHEFPEGSGPPPHLHPWDEAFYVISGRLSFMIDGAARDVPAGTLVHLPAGTVHGFTGAAGMTTALSVTSTSGSAALVDDLDRAGREGPLGHEQLVEIANAHRVRPLVR